MPTVKVFKTPDLMASCDMSGSVAVIIDVLRATSSLVHAFSSGCRLAIPAMNRQCALLAKKQHPNALLCGEENGVKIPGFDLGNSPQEYTPAMVRDKEIIMTTSNGTKAILGAHSQGAGPVLICSFLNLGAVVRRCSQELSTRSGNTFIVCSGSHGAFSLEDFICAGALAHELETLGFELHPAAKEAMERFEMYQDDILRALQDSPHGQYLASIGFEGDLAFCARMNAVTNVPSLTQEGLIR
ncbi:MAG: 2-phosphosulfolactate phosphatase [Bacillota bacterium]